MNRRDLIMGGSLLAAVGGAAILQPRKRLVLLGDRKLDDVIPQKVGDWQNFPSSDFVLPKSPGSLSDRLYSQTLSRLYRSPTQLPMMVVIAYGAVQNDLLQLHRPEACYAAVGYTISASRRALVDLGNSVELPVRELTAQTDSRMEQICYWTRIGDDLPTDGTEQRRVKLQQQLRGYLADGILVRMSTPAENSPAVFAQLTAFATAMVRAMKPADRDILIGRPLAAGLKV
ncbi:MAG: exosortase-associated protein EpsI, V-type [Polymorphobacter sp.]